MNQTYSKVADSIIKAIESGEAKQGQWAMPWHRRDGGSAMPVNATTGNVYRGVNVLSLWAAATTAGYDSNNWASYKQWQARGAQVRKGERGTSIVFYRKLEYSDIDTAGNVTTARPLLARFSAVFNVAQVDGWLPAEVEPAELPTGAAIIASAEAFIYATGATVQHGGDRACYAPGRDVISMPDRAQFIDTDADATANYYSTLFHELGHWTGHKSRLDRSLAGRFGEAAYAFEELIAELCAAYTCAAQGISCEPRADHARYIASWLKACKAEPQLLFRAASLAASAADYLQQPAGSVAAAA